MTETTLPISDPAPLLRDIRQRFRECDNNRDRASRFIELAELGTNTWRAYLAGLRRIVLYPLLFGLVLGFVMGVVLGLIAHVTHQKPAPLGPVLKLVLQFGASIACGAGVIVTVLRSHRRPFLSLVSPDLRFDWRRLAIGLAVELVLRLAVIVAAWAATGRWLVSGSSPVGLGSLAVTALILCLVPLQAASEELLFRGYLTQALGRITHRKWLIVSIVAALFAAAHLQVYGPYTLPFFMILSTIYSLVSLRDGRLELAMGAHIGMNLFAMLLVNATIATDGAVHFHGNVLGVVAVAILPFYGLLYYGLTRLAVRWLCDRQALA